MGYAIAIPSTAYLWLTESKYWNITNYRYGQRIPELLNCKFRYICQANCKLSEIDLQFANFSDGFLPEFL